MEATFEDYGLFLIARGGHLLKQESLVKVIARREVDFSKSPLPENSPVPSGGIPCPICGFQMAASHYSPAALVYLDQCLREGCRAVWCDKGELEAVQILIERASAG